MTEDAPRPDPEVPARPKRRTYTEAYKRRILDALDAATRPGEKSALLRQEGLYSSTLTEWRRARAGGVLGEVKLGRPPKDPRDVELEKLRRDNQRLEEKLQRAQLVIDVQKKVSELLGVLQPTEEEILRSNRPR